MLELNTPKNATAAILSPQDRVRLLPATAQHHAVEMRQRHVVEETDSTCTGVALQGHRLTLGLVFGLLVDVTQKAQLAERLLLVPLLLAEVPT